VSWDELVAGALVGTARRAPVEPTAEGALGEVLSGLDPADPEGTLLAAGAVLGLYRQAGRRLSVHAVPLQEPSPTEGRHSCSEAAADRLHSILNGPFRAVLGEWLALLATVDRLVPPDRLPGLLDAATANPRLRASTVAVGGERGRWLAGRNPRWAWAGGGSTPDTTHPDSIRAWATGSAASRRLLLARMRASDPGAARELLESTWATETPEDRAAFVAVLTTRLSMDDEPFLEGALDDRRKEVRQAAAQLLWRLPESRLGQRMAERSEPLVRTSTLPDQVDPAMVRDGVVVKPPVGQGERAWWFLQLVAATPLRTWGDPAALVTKADLLLRQAWAAAAARQRDEAWALALLGAGGVDEPALLGAVPHDRAVALALDRISSAGLTPAVLDLLDHCPVPWGPELSGAVVDRLGTAVKRQGRPDAEAVALRAKMADLAARLDPSVTVRTTAELAECTGWWSDVVSWFCDLLAFRADMGEELRP